MAQVTGIVKLKTNGKLLRSKPGAKLDTGGRKREAVTGHSVYGYTESVVASSLDCTIAHTADTDVAELNGLTGATLVFECDTGVSYLVSNAFTSEPCQIASGGDMTFKMAGDPAVQQ